MRQERRRHPRLEMPLEAEMRLAGGTASITATMEDLSAGGAGLLSTFEIPVGTEIERFAFELPTADGGERTIEVAARVARCERQAGVSGEAEFLIGVQFVGIDRELFDQIQKFVFKRLRRSKQERVQIERPIAIRFERFDDFVEEVSLNLSPTGMFIRTRDPRPPGSVFNFQFQLGEDFSLIEGRAEVVWRRRQAEGADRQPGMGVKFLNLDVPSQRLISRLISQKAEAREEAPAEAAVQEPSAIDAVQPAATPATAPEAPSAVPAAAAPPDLRYAEASIVSLAQFDNLRNETGRLAAELEAARREHERELQDLRAQLEDRQAAASSELEERLRDAEAAHKDSERLRGEMAGELEALRQEAAELRHELGGRASNEELQSLASERQAIERAHAELEHQLDESRGEAAALRRQLDDRPTREDVERLADEMAGLRTAHDELRLAHEGLEDELGRVRREAAELESQLDSRPPEEEVQRLATERNAVEATNERLLADLDGANAEADELRRQLADRDRAVAALEAELANLERELEGVRGELDEAGRDRQAAFARVEAEHEAALARAEEDHREAFERAIAEDREEAAARLQRAEEETAAARERADALAEELDALRQHEALEGEAVHAEAVPTLAETRDGADWLKAELSRAEEKRRQTEAELEQVRLQARQAAQQAEQREAALRADAENAVLAAGGMPQPSDGDRRRRPLAAAALMLLGLLLGVLAVTFIGPLDSLTGRLRSGGATAEEPVAVARRSPEGAQPDAIGQPPAPPAASGGSVTAEPTAAPPPQGEPEPEPAPEPEPVPVPDAAEAEQAVLAWAAAWSDQRVDDYLAGYATSFQPPDGQDRDAWAEVRRQRIERPRSIAVGIESPRTVELAGGRVSVSFDQAYSSDNYADRVRKTLVMVWEDGAWKIAEERVIE